MEEHSHSEDAHAAHEGHSHGVHESSWAMLFPLVVLAILSVIGGWVGVPEALGGHNEIEHFLAPVFSVGDSSAAAEVAGHGTEIGLAVVSVVTAFLGFAVAFYFYILKPGTSKMLTAKLKPVHTLLENKFYIDEIYDAFILTPIMVVSRLLLAGLVDKGVVNGVPAATSAGVRGLGSLTRRMQSGNIRSYAGWLALGAAAVVLFMIFGNAASMHL